MNDSDILSSLEAVTYTYTWDKSQSSTGSIATDVNTMYDVSSIGTINIGNLSLSDTISYSDTITFPDFSNINITEFEGMMPPIEKVKEMCEEYPALEKAYENFKLIYKLVHDDWVSKQENPHG